ncbi:hydroxymethylglutaryl-CoA synthase [Micromonospora sp. NPDC002296]|uniref:hydroxymethylglutaryl-CoA synthase family protein n=1 Tax=Micromonospora sp. NPDC002296 TaxID=3154271 RepID=UPI003330942B
MSTPTVGVEGLNAYAGVARISTRAMFTERGLNTDRFANLQMEQRSVQLPWEDPVTNAVNAALPLVAALSDDERGRIELLVTSTESGLDYSKSVASYVHEFLGLPRTCRVLEVKQACYGATGAVQLAVGHLASGISPGAKALVIATDVNPMDEHAGYAEPTTGHGAVAVLVSDRPRLLALDVGAYGINSFETMDTARPRPDFDLYHADRSLLTYLECLSDSYRAYLRRVPGTRLVESFDHIVMHTPFAGMVRAGHRKLMREFAPRPPAEIEADFVRRVAPSLRYTQQVGNLCSGSVWLGLASLIDNAPASTGDARVALYSYGSGCASEFFSGRLVPGAAGWSGRLDIAGRLALRRELTFKEYEGLLPASRQCLVPKADHTVDLAGHEEYLEPFRAAGPMLVLESVANYRRRYGWR